MSSEFRGTYNELVTPPEPVNVGAKVKLDFVCSKCGATNFKWITTAGKIKVGGFQPEGYEYQCLGCNKVYTDADVKTFFGQR